MVEEIKLLPDQTDATGTASMDEAALIASREKWFEEAKKYWDPQRQKWRLNEKRYKNDVEVDTPRKNTKLKFAFPLSVIETELPIISDYLPTFDVMPDGANDIFFADMMQKRKNQLTSKAKLKRNIIETTKDSLKLSNGLTSILPRLKGDKLCGLDISVVDIFTWFPAPNSINLDIRKGCRYQIFATPMHPEEVKKDYNKDVTPEGYLDEYQSFKAVDEAEKDKADMVLVKECYTMDADEKTYPNGRITIWANNVLLADDPLWGDYKPEDGDDYLPPIPYFMIGNYRSAHSIIGIGEPELTWTMVKCLNEVMSSIAENIKKSGNPIRLITEAWWKWTKKKIIGHAGENVIVRNVNDISWDVPPNIPAYTFTFIETLLKLTDVVTGIHDIIEGKKPTGITAASAIQELKESAQARVRFKISNEITDYVHDMGKFIVWLIQQYDEEIVSIREREANGEFKFVKFDPVNRYVNTNNLDEVAKAEEDSTEGMSLKDSKLDIEVVTGTRLPSGRVASEERAINLYKEGIYGIEAVVRALAESNKKDIIEDYYKRKGLEELVKYQEERNKAFKEFEKLVDKALNDEEWEGTLEERQMQKLILQFPDFLQTMEFEALTDEQKERVFSGFMQSDDESS